MLRQLLARNVIAGTSPYVVIYARLAPCLVNKSDDVERTVGSVREISD